MSLQDCIRARGLVGQLQDGMKALGANTKRVTVNKPRKSSHSIALDDALKSQHPHDPRWDYGIGITDGKHHHIAWVEVHTATSSEVDAVLNKLSWLKAWLVSKRDVCKATPATFHWVATDAGVHIDLARRRRLNAAGLQMPQSLLRL